MKKISKKSLIVILFVISLFAIIIKINRQRATIAIIHTNQYIGQVEEALFDSNCEVISINTREHDLENIREIINEADGVVFAGGNDFDPSLYGGESLLVEEYSREDDIKALDILEYTISSNKAILGICRGMQLINIYYGGSLYEDIPSQYGTQISHRGDNKSLINHDVYMNGSYLSELLGQDYMMVNSLHHEAIKDLADGLRIEAQSEDGIIEAIINPYYPYMLGIQWHPEISYYDDDFSRTIFRDFVKHAVNIKKS